MLKLVVNKPASKKAKRVKSAYLHSNIAPEALHLHLAPTATVAVTFSSTRAMQSYRRMLYTINKQGQYRYRTIRDETQGFGVLIWRMK